jgi:hypothetical protein
MTTSHLLHLKKRKKEMMTSQGGSLSSTTLEEKKQMMTNLLDPRCLLHLRKKNKEMTMSQGGSSPFVTHEKKKDEDEPPSSLSSSTPKNKIKMRTSLLAHRHLLHLRKKPRNFFSPYIF